VRVAIDDGEMGSKMTEDFDQKRPPLPPFSSSMAGMLSSLFARWNGDRFYMVWEGARWARSRKGEEGDRGLVIGCGGRCGHRR
jgi:hypothetical protein